MGLKPSDYDEKYEIRLARYDEIEKIMDFIGTEWKKGHILSQDRHLFEYEFVEDKEVHILLAVDRDKQSIEALFGYLPCSQAKGTDRYDIWGSFWKVINEKENLPFLGVELARRIYPITGCRMHIGNGANPNTTVPLRKIFFRDHTVKMKQYYMLDESRGQYRICCIKNKKIRHCRETGKDVRIYAIESFIELKQRFTMEGNQGIPYKDDWYVEKRYFKHPYYKYKVFTIEEKKNVRAVIIGREISVGDSRVFRIVDYLGEHRMFAHTGNFWKGYMRKHDIEYIDFYEFGMDDSFLKDAGFVLRQDDDCNIIPNYFEPFCQENVDIWCHYKYEGTTFFKADCDQDRPNSIGKVHGSKGENK